MAPASILLDAPNTASGAKHMARGPRFASLPPLSLYVHVPWCVRKCPYCDFNSHELRASLPEREYVDALTADLEQFLPRIWGRPVYTIFFGGGTPSLFSPQAIDAVLQAVRARVRLDATAEITLEANPGTADAGHFEGYRAAGVNRLSIGVQSFDDAKLAALGRIHDGRQARQAIELAQRHFANVNIDLMYALPSQTAVNALADIEAAIAIGPTHISAYHLTIEPNTLFHRFPPPVPDDDAAAEMQDAIEARLAQAGYENYETSAFARPGCRCAHNLNYWRFGDYLGIGAGAHSKISFPERIVREMKHKHPRQYMAQAAEGAVQEAHEVPARDLPFEFMMNALRMTDGFALRLYEERTGLPLTSVLSLLDAAERDGLIERDHLAVRPSARGRRFLNDLLQRFLPIEGSESG
ncbi:MAG: oxygen-independent coproporphyrinogen III oxidase-like protein [Betaproteobacteria bacterium]|nr:oxygen-independent coproporphyrinogen III oxidase-like protein [Betaproteobacteria bacterium]